VPAVDVRLVDVVKRYGEAVAVDHINLEVQTGEFFSLLGPSGCGKTTTLRMIGGFEAPTSGLIELKGQDVTWLPPYKRHVNTVFQNYALFPHLTVYENVAFGLRRSGAKEDEVRSRVTEMLKLVELPGFENRKPNQVSGGQAQRVALARALINRPSVLLLDEPLGALDLKLRKQMQVELKRIQQEVGITFIFVTHDQEEAMTMSDRIAVMNHGKYEQLADPASLYEKPRTRFVASFLGVSNLLAAKAAGTADGYTIARMADDTPIRVPSALVEGFDGFEVGVRPEKIKLSELTDPVPDGVNQLQGVIRDASYLGVSTSYIIDTRGGGSVTVYEQNVERATRAELWRPGEDVRLTWLPDHTFAVEGSAPPAPPADEAAALLAAAVPPPPPVVSRRRFLIGGALAVGAVGLVAFLANSNSGGTAVASASPSGAASPTPLPSVGPSASAGPETPPPNQVATGPLKFANWPAYIDQATEADQETGVLPAGSSKTLVDFTAKYGVEVDYEEKIGDNATFVQTITPALVGGLPTGWDLMVLTDWMAGKLIGKQWCERILKANVPNCVANLREPMQNVAWDPGNDFHFPWQSGMTGVGYNAKTLAENNIAAPTKIADLWAIPADKVTFLTEARDTFGLGLLKLGIKADPATVTAADLQRVKDDMQPLVDGGLRFQGNEYLQDFAQKKAWAAMVWSGDLASSGGPDDNFVFPEEGTMIWTDNMLIPKGAANKYTAELMMNFVYDIPVAAQIADYVYYVSPVDGISAAIEALDPGASTNPLLFPPPEVVAKQQNFQFLSPEIEDVLNALYANLSGT
jgi:spermidine/putrescine transport system ATP-binding protein